MFEEHRKLRILVLISWHARIMENYRDDEEPIQRGRRKRDKYKENGRGIEKGFVMK